MMIAVKDALKCAFLVLLVIAVAWAIRIEMTANALLEQVPDQIEGRMDKAGAAVNARLSDVIASVDSRMGALIARSDARTGQALGIIDRFSTEVPSLIDRHAANAETILDSQLTTLDTSVNQYLSPIGALAERYTLLPDQIRADRETQGLIAETMGVLGATKVTMGQVAKASKTFDEKWPDLLDNGSRSNKALSDIAVSLDKWIATLTMPQSVKSQIANWVKVLILAASHIL